MAPIAFEIARRDNNIDERIVELPNSDQADHVHEPQLNVSKHPDVFEANMKNENVRCLPPPKAKLKSRGGDRGRKIPKIDPHQPKIDAIWKKKDRGKDGGSQ